MKPSWWRAAFYPWGYPRNPDGKPDSPLCAECGPLVVHPWERNNNTGDAFVVVTYRTAVDRGEQCFRCGVHRETACARD